MGLNSDNTSASDTNGGGSDGEVTVEAYSVVLSVTALVLATVFGGGGSISVLLAIFQSRRVKKYSYTLILVFFFLCCGLDLLWSPVEIGHLLAFHYTQSNPTLDFAVATFAIYAFLCTGLAILVAAFCAENVLRLSQCFPEQARRAWPVAVCAVMFLTSLIIAVCFLYASLGDGRLQGQGGVTYIVLHLASSLSRVTILAVVLVLVVAGAVAVVVAAVLTCRPSSGPKTSESFISGQSNTEYNNAVPQFLINQTEMVGAEESDDNMDKLSTTPSTPKLPDIISPDPLPPSPGGKVRNSPRLTELPVSQPRGSNMLGVNMAQVLGRRRHTICQIGDSSTGSPADPLTKAKQYNYVRKFSVDISALQAQLENPKLFKDTAPFVSDQDLMAKPKSKAPEPPRAPLFPTHNTSGPSLGVSPPVSEDSGSDPPKLGLSLKMPLPLLPSRPPVITVSEEVKEDVEGEIEEEGKDDSIDQGCNSVTRPPQEFAPILNKSELTSIPVLPINAPVDEDDEEGDGDGEEERRRIRGEEGEEEDASFRSCPHEAGSNNRLTDSDRDFVKMALLMALTFFTCEFPLFVIEAVKGSVNAHTYVNLATCARALSAIQTIIYPHIVVCMDSVVSKAVNGLKARVTRACHLRDGDCLEIQPEHGSSSTSQM